MMNSKLTQFKKIAHLPLGKIRRQMKLSDEQLLDLLKMWQAQGLVEDSQRLIDQLTRRVEARERNQNPQNSRQIYESYKSLRMKGRSTSQIARALGKSTDRISRYNLRWYNELIDEGLDRQVVLETMNIPEEEIGRLLREQEEKARLRKASLKKKKTLNALYAESHLKKIATEFEKPGDYLIFDLEGIQEPDELIEIAVMDLTGQVLLNTLVRPSHKINHHIEGLTGITNQMAEKGESIHTVMRKLQQISNGKILMSWGTDYDKVLLQKSQDATGINLHCQFVCAQKIHMGFKGLPNQVALHKAVGTPKQSHRALDDCEMVLEVMKNDVKERALPEEQTPEEGEEHA